MLVSYVLTAYNIENFIEESIQCAFNQTYEPLEIILSDDCSTDRTYEIMERMANEYKGPHKIVLNRNPENLGITKHMNKAYLDLAQGDIIIAAHGDDVSVPERTQIQVDFLLNNPNVTAVSGGIVVISEDGKVRESESKNTVVSEIRHYNLNNPKETGIANIPAPSRAFWKRVMSYFGPLNDDCPTEDELISFRSLLLGENVFLPDVLVKYRKHKNSSSNPENFDKFPLEKIREQQIRDMEFAVKNDILTNEKKQQIEGITLNGMIKRKLYRKYFADPSIKNLYNLVSCRLVAPRAKISYVLRHFIK